MAARNGPAKSVEDLGPGRDAATLLAPRHHPARIEHQRRTASSPFRTGARTDLTSDNTEGFPRDAPAAALVGPVRVQNAGLLHRRREALHVVAHEIDVGVGGRAGA